MLDFKKQLLELDDVYEEDTFNTNGIEDNLVELGTLFMKIFSKMTKKKKLLLEDNSIISEKQQECINIMKEILEYIGE